MKARIWIPIALLLVTPLFGAGGPVATPNSAPDAGYQQSFDKWKAELVDDLKENWLPLAGLFWLKPGENTFGTDNSNSIVFPKGPAKAGVFTLQGEQVTVEFLPGAQAKIEGKTMESAKLDPDTSGHRTVVEMGSLRMHVIVRGQRVGIRLKDLNSPAVRSYTGPVFYPINLDYRVTATWVPS